ncbi:MAG: 5-(carboxyamino)imidazole ribonucleotide synthase [Chitinophagales bacterium]
MALNKKIGILGGGQLGRMFIENALRYDAKISILDPAENAPCKHIVSSFTKGSFKDFETVLNFGKQNDIISIEIEHVNTDALKALEKLGKKVIPTATAIETIKDKGLQKDFYKKHNIKSSEFVFIDKKEDLKNHLDFLPAFMKSRTDGYDGKGVVFLKDENDFNKAFDVPSILEKAVDIEKELSVIVIKNESGEMQVFPTVELVFDPIYNLVDYLISPASISDEQDKTAKDLALKVCKSLNSEGIFAIELFLSKQGEILVNETAPRTHNSGHHTIESCASSQFDQQLRALLNLPLGNTDLRKKAAMVNIVGEENFTGKVKYEGLNDVLALSDTYIHLYGKEITKPGRKMGHITILGNEFSEIKEKIDFIKKNFKTIA